MKTPGVRACETHQCVCATVQYSIYLGRYVTKEEYHILSLLQLNGD